MTKVAAILLAAGQSTRMGAFKQLLPFGQKTVIENCIDYLKLGGADPIIVVLGHRSEDIRAQIEHLSVRFALNPDPESEMGASIACGARELPADAEATLIAPTDFPAIPAEVVTALINSWRTRNAKLLAPKYEGRGGHPVLIDLCFRDRLLHLDSQRGLRGLFDEHRELTLRIPVNTPFVARDIDTWDDYRTLHTDVFGTEPPKLAAQRWESGREKKLNARGPDVI